MASALHRHDEFSTYDGMGTAIEAARYAKEIGLVGLSITNHGNMSSCVRHYHACKEVGVIPILGCEVYFMPEFNKDLYKRGYHLTVLCMDNIGYSNLCQMLSIAAEENYFFNPIVTWELLEQYHEGLIVLSGCLGALIPRLLTANELTSATDAEEWLLKFKALLGDRFYGEVQPYDTDGKQTIVNTAIIDLCRKHDINVAMTVDSHFTRPDDEETHRVMMAMKSTNSHSQDMNTYHNRHIPSEIEMLKSWQALMGYDGSEYVTYTDEIAYRCEDVNIEWEEVVPSLDWGENSVNKLYNLCKAGLKEKGKYSGENNRVYRDRLTYEFDVIRKKNFIDYFLLCHDVYRFAGANNIRTNYGRGSVCGSILAYSLGITGTDAIKHNIPFDTFLREDKNTIPDIDMDFPRSKRGIIISYLMNKYEGRAAQISTYGYYRVKNLLNDLAKVLEVKPDDLTWIKKRVESIVKDEDAEGVDAEGLYDILTDDNELAVVDCSQYKGLILHFSRLFGQVKYIGKHAAGIAISEQQIDTICPLIRTKNGLQTSYDLGDLGRIGIVKFDILGLAMLDTVAYCEELIGKSYDVYEVENDENVLEDFKKGLTSGVFQFESRQVKEYFTKQQPSNIDDIFAMNAINRPGALHFGYLDKYIDRKELFLNEPEQVTHDVPAYELDIAPDTYGVFIYSDHIIQLCLYAGLDRQETDKLIKAVSKKTIGKYKALADKMIVGLEARGLSSEEATQTFKCLSLYGLKKAHAVGYGLLSYYSAYLKHYHPIEYFCALLRSEETEEKRIEYELEARNAGISVMIATVNGSSDYTIIKDSDGDEWIQKGLSSIKDVGDVAGKMIEANAPYESIGDMRATLPIAKVNGRAYEALEDAGAILFNEKDIINRSYRYNKSLPLALKQARQQAFKH